MKGSRYHLSRDDYPFRYVEWLTPSGWKENTACKWISLKTLRPTVLEENNKFFTLGSFLNSK